MGEGVATTEAERRFARVYAHYEPYVRRYVARRVAPAAVDDIVADVFMTTWRRLADVPDDALPWLYRAAYNHTGTYYRGQGRRSNLIQRIASAPDSDPADPFHNSVEIEHVRAVLLQMSEVDAEILLLALWEDLEIADIAKVLDISTSATRVRKHRAIRRFAKLWRASTAPADPPFSLGAEPS